MKRTPPLAASTEEGRAVLQCAARWHEWAPPWLPGRAAAVVRQVMLRRYARSILCELPTGQQFIADPSDLVQCLVGTTGGWEQLIFEALRPFVSAGDAVLDAGAHVGYAALRFGEWVGAEGRVVCFEPAPDHLHRLRQNVHINGYESRTIIVPLAVADGQGVRPFFDGASSNTGMGSLNGSSRQVPSRHVQTISIDEWLHDAGIARLALAKIDVEGAEALVLKGMSRSLTDRRYRAVVVELHPGIVPAIGRHVTTIFRDLPGAPYCLYEWQSEAQAFLPVSDVEPSGYLLAVRRDATHLVAGPRG